MITETTPQDRVDRRLVLRHRSGDPRALRELKRRWTPHVRSLARTLARTDADVDQLARAGTAELVAAVHAFDPEAGTRFSTFAASRIAVAMRHADAERPKDAASIVLAPTPNSADRTVVAVRRPRPTGRHHADRHAAPRTRGPEQRVA